LSSRPARSRRATARARLAASAPSILALLALNACSAGPSPEGAAERRGEEIVACGSYFRAGTPVVLFSDPGGYDAYRKDLFFPDEPPAEKDETAPAPGLRFGERPGSPDDLRALARTVDLFVLHYDAAGTSRQCFKTLHDRRGLSVHFLLDLDGTLYQTLDLRERAWHAGAANDRSVGVEIANVGAYADGRHERLKAWYERDAKGVRVTIPPRLGPTGLKTRDFVARPARDALVSGRVHGRTYHQYDFTDAQYAALARLARALSAVLPRIRLDAPRDRRGAVRTDVLSEKELRAFSGVIGHSHVTTEKIDPGPAFDWDRLFREAR
jgi:N-acetyl-anhydromuramyl-L-alanine amidase AmpD